MSDATKFYPVFNYNVAGHTDNLLAVQGDNNCFRGQDRDSTLLDYEKTLAAYQTERARVKEVNSIVEIGD